jgi:hypothetical protein
MEIRFYIFYNFSLQAETTVSVLISISPRKYTTRTQFFIARNLATTTTGITARNLTNSTTGIKDHN